MTTITTKETHRLGNRVNVFVVGGTYDRFVDAKDWDADPKAVTAQIADYLAKKPQPEVVSAAVKKDAVVMTDAEVEEKLSAIADPAAIINLK